MFLTVNASKEVAHNDLAKVLPDSSSVVYMCIGCDKVLSDSLGPRVGSLVQQKMKKPIFIYGLLNNNISAVNLVTAYKLIKTFHSDKKIVVIDAAVGEKSQIGAISFSQKPLKPGSATNKNLPSIGDYSIMGIVASNGLSDFYTTTYDKLVLIEQMAQVISEAIVNSDFQKEELPKNA